MKSYLKIAAIILLHASAIMAAVSVNIDANGVNSDADPLGALAMVAVAYVMLKASDRF